MTAKSSGLPQRILLGLTITVLTLIAAVLIVPGFLDWSAYKGQITQAVEQATGRKLTIDGEIGLRVFPQPALSVEKIELSGPPGMSGQSLLKAASIEALLELTPLFTGDVQFQSIVIEDGALSLVRDEAGNANWDFDPPDEPLAEAQDTEGQLDTRTDQSFVENIRLDSVIFRDFAVSFEDQAAQTKIAVNIQQAEVAAGSLQGPYRLQAEILAGEEVLSVKVGAGSINALSESANVSLDASIGDALSVGFDGSLRNFSGGPRVNGKLVVSGSSLSVGVVKLGSALSSILQSESLPSPLPAAFDRPFEMSVSVAASEKEVRIRDLEARIEDQRIEGDLAVLISDVFEVDGAIKLLSWNLDTWVSSSEAETPEPQSSLVSDGGDTEFSLPNFLRGQVSVDVENMRWQGQSLKQASVLIGFSRDAILISEGDAQLSGGGSLSLNGALSAKSGQPSLSMTTRFQSPNLGMLLRNIGVASDGLPPNRFGMTTASALLKLDGDRFRVEDLDVTMDGQKVEGAISGDLSGPRPSFDVIARIDSLPLDDYLAMATKAQKGSGTGEPAKPTQNKPVGVDVVADILIEKLIWKKQAFNNVAAKIDLRDGVAQINELVIDDVLGTSVRTNGVVSLDDPLTNTKLRTRLKSADLSQLARALGVDEAALVARISPFDGQIDVAISGSTIDLSVTGTAAGAKLSAVIKGRNAADSILTAEGDFDLEINAPSLAVLAKLAGTELETRVSGVPARLKLSGTGSLKSVNAEYRFDYAGANLKGQATATGLLLGPKVKSSFSLTAPDYVKFLEKIGYGYQAEGGDKLGGFIVKGDIIASEKQIGSDNLTVTLPGIGFTGALNVALDGTKPKIALNIQGGDWVLDPLLPVADTTGTRRNLSTAPQKPTTPAPRWSRKSFDLAMFETIDADIEVAAKSVFYNGIYATNLTLQSNLQDTFAPVSIAASNVFGGEVRIDGQVRADGGALETTLSINLKDARIEDLSLYLLQDPKMTGSLEIAADLDARGATEYALISSLSGVVRMSARDGIIRGVDLKQFSGQLNALNDSSAFLSLAGTAFAGGQTSFRVIETVQSADKGIFTTAQFDADVDAAEMSLATNINLPLWRINSAARLKLRDHPNAPDVGVSFAGALDNPKRIVDTRAMQQFLVNRFLERGLGRLLGIKNKKPVQAPVINTPQPAPIAQPAYDPNTPVPSSKPVDTAGVPRRKKSDKQILLEGVLNELFKKK